MHKFTIHKAHRKAKPFHGRISAKGRIIASTQNYSREIDCQRALLKLICDNRDGKYSFHNHLGEWITGRK